jgi:hypothetical protein
MNTQTIERPAPARSGDKYAAMCRCLIPTQHMRGLSRSIPCGGLLADTAEARQEHARDVHGIDIAPESVFVRIEEPIESRGSSSRCECGAAKPAKAIACSECCNREHARRQRPGFADVADQARRQRNFDARDRAKAEGRCAMCRVRPAAEDMVCCSTCLLLAAWLARRRGAARSAARARRRGPA